MQPQQPPQLSSNPVPLDYLNQIAAPQKSPRFSNKLVVGLIGGVLVLVVVFLVIALSMNGAPKTTSLERLALRLQTLQKISQSAQPTIKSSQLRSINSSLKTGLINANRDIATPLTAAKIDLKKADSKLVAAENGQKLTATLEDARLNATFDRTYANEMSYQLETTVALMNSLFKTARSTSLKTFLQSSTKDLSSLQTQFSEYSAANT